MEGIVRGRLSGGADSQQRWGGLETVWFQICGTFGDGEGWDIRACLCIESHKSNYVKLFLNYGVSICWATVVQRLHCLYSWGTNSPPLVVRTTQIALHNIIFTIVHPFPFSTQHENTSFLYPSHPQPTCFRILQWLDYELVCEWIPTHSQIDLYSDSDRDTFTNSHRRGWLSQFACRLGI